MRRARGEDQEEDEDQDQEQEEKKDQKQVQVCRSTPCASHCRKSHIKIFICIFTCLKIS